MNPTTLNTSATNGASAASLNSKAGAGTPEVGSADVFLKLLVTQMQNQDPMNPMDNAQITTQIAQINTVKGIAQLNTSVQSLGSQFTQMQALQGAALVGRGVTLPGNQLSVSNNQGLGAFELAGPADSVKVEVLNAGGHAIDSINFGAETMGRHYFTWNPPAGITDTTGLTFRVTAVSGAAQVSATPLMHDTVQAVNTSGDQLTLELARLGTKPYSEIKSVD